MQMDSLFTPMKRITLSLFEFPGVHLSDSSKQNDSRSVVVQHFIDGVMKARIRVLKEK